MAYFAIFQRPSLSFLIICYCSMVLSTGPMLDLNQPPPDCFLEDVQTMNAAPVNFPAKRETHPAQLLSLSPPTSRIRLSHTGIGEVTSSPGMSAAPANFPAKRKTHPAHFLSLSQPTSRLRLSHTDTDEVPSSSDFVKPRLIVEDEVHRSDSRGKQSVLVDDQAVRKRISQSNTGKTDQTPHHEPEGAKQAPYGCFISHGRVLEELLNKFSTTFKKEVKEIPASVPWHKHQSLPFTRVRQKGGNGLQVFRVLERSGKRIQLVTELSRLYNRLAVSLYMRHGETLDRFNVSTFDRRVQQGNLLHWLFKHLFNPDDGPPVLGIARHPHLDLSLNDPEMKIGAIQEKLIMYFSQDSTEVDEDVGEIADDLLKSYRDLNTIDYSTLDQRTEALDKDRRIMESHFKESTKFLSTLVNAREISICGKSISTQHILFFEETVDILKQMHVEAKVSKVDIRSHHPNLPIAMFFGKTENNKNVVRIIKPDGQVRNERDDIIPKFKKLLKVLDHLHVKVLQRLSVNAGEFIEMRKQLFQYTVKEITKPDFGLPLVGFYEFRHEGIPPWYDESQKNVKLFGDFQLKLLGFFTGDLTDAMMQDVSQYILNLWYYHNHQSYFQYFDCDLPINNLSKM